MTAEDSGLLVQLDLFEAEMWFDAYTGGADAGADLRISVERRGGAAVMTAAAFDVLAFNRVVGLGLETPAAEEDIDRIVQFYTDAGTPRFFVQVSPHAMPRALVSWLEARGLGHHNNWVKLFREAGEIEDVETDLRIEEIGPDRADVAGRIITEGFGMPAAAAPLVTAAIGRPGWRYYAAFQGDTAIAAGSVFIRPPFAGLSMAATLEEYRGRGAQGALVRHRLRAAREMGGEIWTVETAEPNEDRDVPSYRNMLRYGFEVAYHRPNYIGIVEDGH